MKSVTVGFEYSKSIEKRNICHINSDNEYNEEEINIKMASRCVVTYFKKNFFFFIIKEDFAILMK